MSRNPDMVNVASAIIGPSRVTTRAAIVKIVSSDCGLQATWRIMIARKQVEGVDLGVFLHDDYVEMTMHFRCNLRCEHCMIEGTMDWLRPESADRFHQILDYNQTNRRWKGLILTGSEITLRTDLP